MLDSGSLLSTADRGDPVGVSRALDRRYPRHGRDRVSIERSYHSSGIPAGENLSPDSVPTS